MGSERVRVQGVRGLGVKGFRVGGERGSGVRLICKPRPESGLDCLIRVIFAQQ